MTHTPGLWKIEPGVYDTNPETASEFPHGPVILGANGKHIASLDMHREDDAKLFVAALDMAKLLYVTKICLKNRDQTEGEVLLYSHICAILQRIES